jgi:hypothetical protein
MTRDIIDDARAVPIGEVAGVELRRVGGELGDPKTDVGSLGLVETGEQKDALCSASLQLNGQHYESHPITEAGFGRYLRSTLNRR